MTTYQNILIIIGNFEIVSIWTLFGPEKAVPGRDWWGLYRYGGVNNYFVGSLLDCRVIYYHGWFSTGLVGAILEWDFLLGSLVYYWACELITGPVGLLLGCWVNYWAGGYITGLVYWAEGFITGMGGW